VLRINQEDATDVIQALQRYDFDVKSWFMDKGKIDSVAEERYNAFINYMDV
jgi:hypothetical protein